MFELWTEAVRSIEPMVKPAHRDLWLRPIECVGIDDGRIRLRAPNRYHKEWFEDNFLPSILKDLEARAQRPFTVDFEVVEEDAVAAGHVPASVDSGHRSTTVPPAPRAPELVSRYTFDKFVVGPTNQFAHAAARMVAEAPASRWNPLFIYGGVGLGKTHLLQAIGHEIHHQHPEWAITFVTCEKFVTDFIGSMMRQRRRATSMEDFRARYRTAPDVLLIDDIQFLSNKDSSQDEFFHTFNALHYAHKQIVLTSDKLPAELPGVEDRLRSRFTWGLIAEVETPDLETRVAILKRKAESERVSLPDEVALYLAAHIKTNVRELEGALLRLAARASFQGQADLDRAGARRAGQADRQRSDRPHHRGDPARGRRLLRRQAARPQGAEAPPRHRSPAHDRDVPGPQAHQHELPRDRQPVRRQGPLDGHQRRPEDRAPVRRRPDRAQRRRHARRPSPPALGRRSKPVDDVVE